MAMFLDFENTWKLQTFLKQIKEWKNENFYPDTFFWKSYYKKNHSNFTCPKNPCFKFTVWQGQWATRGVAHSALNQRLNFFILISWILIQTQNSWPPFATPATCPRMQPRPIIVQRCGAVLRQVTRFLRGLSTLLIPPLFEKDNTWNVERGNIYTFG